MKTQFTIYLILIFILGLIPTNFLNAANLATQLKGKILLQVEQNGEAWYVNPVNELRYYLGRPDDAFNIMRELGLGISNKDFDSFNGYAPSRLSGRILLKVADSGKAYYVNTNDLKMYYLGRPADAFNVMRELGLGITDKNLGLIGISGMANWKAYSNDKLGFEFKYPKEIVFQSKYTDFVSLADGVEADIPNTYNLPNSFQRSQKIYAGVTSDESKEKCMPEIYSYLPTASENNKTKAEHVNVGNIVFNKYTLPGDCAMDGCGIGYYYTNWQNDRCYKLSWFAIQANSEKSFADSNDPRAIAAKKAGESTTKKMTELTEQILSTFKFTDSVNATGIIKSVYSKSGKNYIGIDYVELNSNWVPGGSAGSAYQNNNPLIRTFEISPNAKFIVGSPATNSITFSDFQKYFANSDISVYQKYNPWDIVIVNGVVNQITEHFVP